MPSRLELQTLLESILNSRNVYYQPPESVKLCYPAIIYKLDDINKTFADNISYSIRRRYSLTLIDENPESPIIDKILTLQLCAFNRNFTSENLNHNLFTIYY